MLLLADASNPSMGEILGGSLPPGVFQGFVIFGAISLVTLGAFAWAAFFRKQKTRRRRLRHHHQQQAAPLPAPAVRSAGNGSHHDARHGRRRRRLRIEAPRNPTLAETAGLPPVRGQSQPPAAPAIPPDPWKRVDR